MNALYISPHLSARHFGGSLFAATNLELLRSALGAPVTAASISRDPHPDALPVPTTKDRLGTALANLQGLCATLAPSGVAYLRELLMRERPTLVWLDTSLLGRLIPLIRCLLPETRVICAFQNVETELIRQRLVSGQLHYLPAWSATWLNERRSARESDITLALHATDGDLIARRYGRAVDRIFPIIVTEPRASKPTPDAEPDAGDPYVLFVGSAFPPNLEALEFISRDITPALRRFRVVAVGNGLDRWASRQHHPKLEVRGFVDDLAALYRNAAAVIAPIYSGGGMKVKIAEALMHGKSVIASPFAAIGFEGCAATSVRLAHSVEAFAAQIEGLGGECYSASARADYDRLFSRTAGLGQVGEILALLDAKTCSG